MPYFCRNPLILTDFYAIQTPIVWHIFGAYFLPIWGVGVVRIIFILWYFLGKNYYQYWFLPVLHPGRVSTSSVDSVSRIAKGPHLSNPRKILGHPSKGHRWKSRDSLVPYFGA